MDLNTSVQKFVERLNDLNLYLLYFPEENPKQLDQDEQFVERLNDLNCYLLYFPEENPKQLDQDEIIEILDQAKARDP
jgi:hypothetical protein